MSDYLLSEKTDKALSDTPASGKQKCRECQTEIANPSFGNWCYFCREKQGKSDTPESRANLDSIRKLYRDIAVRHVPLQHDDWCVLKDLISQEDALTTAPEPQDRVSYPTDSEISSAAMTINPYGRISGAALTDLRKLVKWAIDWQALQQQDG